MKRFLTLSRVLVLYCLFIGIGSYPGTSGATGKTTEDVTLGVLAFRGADAANKRWKATAEYIEHAIKGYRIKMLPLSLGDMKKAVSKGELDFVLTNTGNYVELEARYGITRIATLRTPSKVRAGNVFGAVIFTRADRDDIQALDDLKGKTFMAVERNGFGGFQMAWRELKERGIDPFDDFSSITFTGFPQDQSAYAVLEGKVDAATFRTNTLEAMHVEGAIDLKNFKILNRQDFPGFPFDVSTRLYPEWPFARTKTTSPELAQKVAIALLSMPPDSEAARAGRYGGWTVPLDYQPVHELFRELRIGPYEDIGQITWGDLIKQYGPWIAVASILLFAAVLWATWIEVLVKRRTKELSDTNLELERQISERILAEEEAQLRRAELAHVDRLNTMGEMASGFAHEINQPLAAIINYAQGCTRRINKRQCDNEMILSTLEQVTQQATRAGEIIKRIRAFVRKEAPVREDADVNNIIEETLSFLKKEADRQNIEITPELRTGLPVVSIDNIQIEQVILNLLRNAFEAMTGSDSQVKRLMISTDLSDKDGIVVTVKDTGPGFKDNDGSMFDPFVTSKANGLGLGLSISRSIIEAHGGRLQIVECEEPGTALSFSLPTEGNEALEENPDE